MADDIRKRIAAAHDGGTWKLRRDLWTTSQPPPVA